MGRFVRKVKHDIRRLVKSRGFSTAYKGTPLSTAVKSGNYNEAHRTIVGDGQFAKNMRAAYKSHRKKGYTIANYKGEKVMFVAGTRYPIQWLANAANLVTPKVVEVISNRKADKLTKIAERAGVKTVVGHSRGAYIVNKMNTHIPKLGIDGAAILDKRDSGMMTLNQSNPFDRFLGRQHKDFMRSLPRNIEAIKERKWRDIHLPKSAKNVHYYRDRHFLRSPLKRWHRMYKDYNY